MSFNPGSTITPSQDDPLEDSVLIRLTETAPDWVASRSALEPPPRTGKSSAACDHPIQDLTAEDGLTPLPSWTPGAKTIADDGLVAEARILHPALTMVPCHHLPTAPTELLHHRDRPIPRG